ncbi:hypothetical protein ACH6CV_14305 [Bacillota bacterium Meth-B3]
MKKIIANKVYDTEKAKRIGGHDDGMPGDLYWLSEDLYQKRTGEFFLHGEGGAATKYARTLGQNSWSGGEQLIPLTYDAAREWAEINLTADEYEETFGAISEDDSVTALHAQIDSATLARARQAAAQNGSTLSAWVEAAIKAALA